MDNRDIWKILASRPAEEEPDLWQTLEKGPVDYGWLDQGDFFAPAPFQEPIVSQLRNLWTEANGVTPTGQPFRFVPNKTYVKTDDAGRNFVFNTEDVVKESKKLLMAGLAGDRLVSELKRKFTADHLQAAEADLTAMLAKDYGLLGPVYAEIGNVFATCQEADTFFKKEKVAAKYLTKMAKCGGCRFFDRTAGVCGVTNKKLVDEAPLTAETLSQAIKARKNAGLMSETTAQALLDSKAPLAERIKKANLTREIPQVKEARSTAKAVKPTKAEPPKSRAITASHVVGSLQQGTSVKAVEAMLATKMGQPQKEALIKQALGQVSLPITAFESCKDPNVKHVASLKVASKCQGCRFNLGFSCGMNNRPFQASLASQEVESADSKKVAAEMQEAFTIPAQEIEFGQTDSGLDLTQIVPNLGDWVL